MNKKDEVIKVVSEMNLNPEEMSRRERTHLQVEIGKMIQNFEDFKRGLPKE